MTLARLVYFFLSLLFRQNHIRTFFSFDVLECEAYLLRWSSNALTGLVLPSSSDTPLCMPGYGVVLPLFFPENKPALDESPRPGGCSRRRLCRSVRLPFKIDALPQRVTCFPCAKGPVLSHYRRSPAAQTALHEARIFVGIFHDAVFTRVGYASFLFRP